MAVFVKKVKSADVRMVITEEKILSNIEKVRKLLDPNSKKQIIKLEQDSYFRDLVESITNYLTDYPNKANFPVEVYKESYSLVEYATKQFEVNNNEIENLLSQREKNVKSSMLLKEAYYTVKTKEEFWIDKLERYEGKFTKNIADALTVIANDKTKTPEEVKAAERVINAKISNLETNLFIEIDLERVEDRIKGLSFIGIEVAEALKSIPAPLLYTPSEFEKEQIQKAVEEEIISSKVQVIEPIVPIISGIEDKAVEEIVEVKEIKPILETDEKINILNSQIEDLETKDSSELIARLEELNNFLPSTSNEVVTEETKELKIQESIEIEVPTSVVNEIVNPEQKEELQNNIEISYTVNEEVKLVEENKEVSNFTQSTNDKENNIEAKSSFYNEYMQSTQITVEESKFSKFKRVFMKIITFGMYQENKALNSGTSI